MLKLTSPIRRGKTIRRRFEIMKLKNQRRLNLGIYKIL